MKRLGLLGLLCSWLLAAFLLAAVMVESEPAQAGEKKKPRLVVLIVVDQMKADYLERWGKLFGKGGLQRLMDEGAWFKNCHYPYAHTMTAPGHASIVTGAHPARHGIIGNKWYDRQLGDSIYPVVSNRFVQVPPLPPRAPRKKPKTPGTSPELCLVPGVTDSLHKATNGKGKVVSLSIKDRAAILLAGLLRCICYWFSSENGAFVTSTYYRDELHSWVDEFNKSKIADRWFGKDWTRCRPDVDYVQHSGPDDVKAESTGFKQGRTFPHPTTGGLTEPGPAYYDAVTASPFGGELLMELAKKAVVAEKLGADEFPDLLCLSFSHNDIIGHIWGPDSQEMLDVTLRTDELLAGFLTFLDRQVGAGNYAVILTADHGVSPIPELVAAQGKPAGRISPTAFRDRANTHLDGLFAGNGGPADWVEEVDYPWIYLNHRVLAGRKRSLDEVEAALVKWLPTQEGILAAYPRMKMQGGPIANDPLAEMSRRTYHRERSGEITLVVKPYYQFTTYLNGTGHGSPHPYDTHVPLLVLAPGIKGGSRNEAVTPLASAVIAAHLLGVPPPPAAEVGLPKELMK